MALTKATQAGSLVVQQPAAIKDLRGITPSEFVRVQTLGAFTAGDGGAGDWVFEKKDLSAEVAAYPLLFIAPDSDLTGRSGAWRQNIGEDIRLREFGLGVTTDEALNTQIMDQAFKYNAGRRWITLPPGTIWFTALDVRVDPKLRGTPGATAGKTGGNGSCLITKDAFSNDIAFRVTSSSGTSANRVTGCFMKDVKLISYDFFNVPNYSTFTARSARTGFSFNYCGGEVDVQGLVVMGFTQNIRVNEMWDGRFYARSMYGGAPDGSVPAVYIGSDASDNTNNMEFKLHIEFSPWLLDLGFVEQCTFMKLKCEGWRNLDATHPGVRIGAAATRVTFIDPHFTTQNATKTHFIENNGQFITIIGMRCAGGQSSDYPYAGIRWYKGNSPTNARCVIEAAFFNRCAAADGTDGNDYPVVLGNYTTFDGTLRVSDSYTTSTGTVTNVNSGLISIGTSCHVKHMHMIVGSGAKSKGGAIYFRAGGSVVDDVSQISGNSIASLVAGSKDNAVNGYGAPYVNTKDAVVDVYGRKGVRLTGAVTLTEMRGLTQQLVTVIATVEDCKIKHDASKIVTLTGQDINLRSNFPYQFYFIDGNKAVQLNTHTVAAAASLEEEAHLATYQI